MSNRARLPIVLLHGMAGFDQIGPLDYFYGVKSRLASDGHQVFVTEVDPFQRIEVRAAQLAPQLRASWRAPARAVHLIAHSRGAWTRAIWSPPGLWRSASPLFTSISARTAARGWRTWRWASLPGRQRACWRSWPTSSAAARTWEGQAYQLTEEYATSVFNPHHPR
ncbi:MAG: hypothetical protein IPI49_33180 [Myxococcales bacterium]|nr:hypothetical protein [Myxococcales bacterium]